MSMSSPFSENINTNILLLIILFSIVLIQGTWIFRDAQKRGIFPWLWGLWGLIQAPLPIIFYYIFVIRKDKKRKNHNERSFSHWILYNRISL